MSEQEVTREQIAQAFERFMSARSELLDLDAAKCEQIGKAPNLANIWTVILTEAAGANAGEQASHLVAGLDHVAETWLREVFLDEEDETE